jgi:hypothetical protein
MQAAAQADSPDIPRQTNTVLVLLLVWVVGRLRLVLHLLEWLLLMRLASIVWRAFAVWRHRWRHSWWTLLLRIWTWRSSWTHLHWHLPACAGLLHVCHGAIGLRCSCFDGLVRIDGIGTATLAAVLLPRRYATAARLFYYVRSNVVVESEAACHCASRDRHRDGRTHSKLQEGSI